MEQRDLKRLPKEENVGSEKAFAKRRLSEHEKHLVMGNVEGNLPKAILKSRPRETSVALVRGMEGGGRESLNQRSDHR